jgi:hypothetical protein
VATPDETTDSSDEKSLEVEPRSGALSQERMLGRALPAITHGGDTADGEEKTAGRQV